MENTLPFVTITVMDTLHIRPMRPDDVPLLAQWMVTVPLWQRYGLQVSRAQAQLKAALKHGDMLFTADLGTHTACGFAWGMAKGAFGRSAYLRLIGVKPDYAGVGVGGKLLEATEQAALSLTGELFLLVSDFNLDGQRFYQRHGYAQIGAIPGYVLPDVTELIYWKRLYTEDTPG